MSGNFNSFYGQSEVPDAPRGSQSMPYDESQGQSEPYVNAPRAESMGAFASAPFGGPALTIDPQFDSSFFVPSPSYDSPQLTSPLAEAGFEQSQETSPLESKPPGRTKRKGSDGEHVKHRRTRSGCYTCRNRRVKCDEKRPTCDRCRKGSRDCVYPEPKAEGKSASSSRSKLAQTQSMENLSDVDGDDCEELSEPSETKPSSASSSRGPERAKPPANPRPSRRPSRPEKTRSTTSAESPTKSPGLTVGTIYPASSLDAPAHNRPWGALPQDQQFYLDYYREKLNYAHYQFKHDADNFFQTTLLDTALQYDPLLYAVVGFAAFHHTVGNPKGKLTTFLTYYNRAVSLLRRSLRAGESHTEAMLITILQLASFEEYLGDWVNLFGHQRAAYEMLLELYEPESVTRTATGRAIFGWYARFDLFAGLMARSKTTLDIEWFRTVAEWWCSMRGADPSNLDYQIESLSATHRVLGWELASLNAKLPKGEIGFHEYLRDCELICERIDAGRRQVAHLWATEELQVMSLDARPDADTDAIMGPFEPGRILQGKAFALNYLDVHWMSVQVMAKQQLSMVLQQPPPQEELFELTMQQMRIIDGIDRWPGSPRGALIPVQTCVAFGGLFLPLDERYTMWCRRMLAKIECLGYILPSLLRDKLAQAWGLSTLEPWWLPDPETCPPVIRSLRAFVEERTTKPRNQLGEDIRAMKAVFHHVNLDSSPSNSPESASNTMDSGASSAAGGAFRKVGSPSSESVKEEGLSPKAVSGDWR